MSFMITWDADKIISDLRACAREIHSPYNEGYSQWGCKQDLYKVKFALDEIINKCPSFYGEQEFLEEQEKKQAWKALSDIQQN